MRQLENDEKDVDDNSILAPLTQQQDGKLPSQSALQDVFNQSQLSLEEKSQDKLMRGKDDFDSDDELFNDFNVTIADMEAFSECVEEKVENIPQFDGTQDEIIENGKEEIIPGNMNFKLK